MDQTNWSKCSNNVCKVLVGNKCDKPDRVVSEEEGKKLAEDFNMSFFEASAKTNHNVKEVFDFLTAEILKTNEGKPQNGSGGKQLNNDKSKNGKKGCCK